MNKQSRCDKVLAHLKDIGSINCSQAFRLYKIAALHSRISNLRERGYDIEKYRQEYFDADGNLQKGWAYELRKES